MIRVADYIFKFIKAHDVKHVFMLSGGGCMHMCDALGRSGLGYICCLHEQAAALAAVGYSQYTQNIGVTLATTGPGGTNTVTGIASAYADSVPLLVLTGQVKTSDMSNGTVRMKGFQEVDIVAITTPITKYAVTVMNPKEIRYHLEKALYLAKNGRPGPVLLDIPLDIQAAMIDEDGLTGFTAPPKEDTNLHIDKIYDMIIQAKRPVIMAGYGINVSGAREKFLALAEKLHIPVLVAWKAMDLMPENHPDYYGRPGSIAGRGANFILQNSDLLITIGARLDFGQTGYEQNKFAPRAKKIIVDIDAAELDKFAFDVDLRVQADAGEFIAAIDSACKDFVFLDKIWLDKCREWKMRYPVILDKHFAMRDYVSQYALMEFLINHTGSGDVFAPGNSGGASEIFMQAYKVGESQRIVSVNGIGSMGTGLPMAIGAAVASGSRVICVNGDGGFQMNIQELETIHRLKLPIKFFILNNNGYNSIRQTQSRYFDAFFVGSSPESGVTLPDTVAVAEAYKLPAMRVSTYKELCDNIGKIMSSDGPFVCEVMVDPDEPTLPKVQSSMDENGKMTSGTLENLYPFLTEEELKENLL